MNMFTFLVKLRRDKSKLQSTRKIDSTMMMHRLRPTASRSLIAKFFLKETSKYRLVESLSISQGCVGVLTRIKYLSLKLPNGTQFVV